MRVNPILHWDYGHVWHFLRGFGLEYCSLYDEGYTSLGMKSQSIKNITLRKHHQKIIFADVQGNDAEQEYWPAFLLSNWSVERDGRTSDRSPELSPTSSGGCCGAGEGGVCFVRLVIARSEVDARCLLENVYSSTSKWTLSIERFKFCVSLNQQLEMLCTDLIVDRM